MKRAVFVLTLVAAMTGLARPSSAAVITFDEAGLVPGLGPFGSPSGTFVSNQFELLGVRFSIGSDGAAYVSNDSYVTSTGFTTNFLTVNTVPPNNVGSPQTTLWATFVDPANGFALTTAGGFSVDVMDGNITPDPRITVQAYDLNGLLIETQHLTSKSSTLSFASSQIARLAFIDNGGDGHVIDNFSFTPNQTLRAQVPGPGTLGLVLAGLAVAGTRRRWRK